MPWPGRGTSSSSRPSSEYSRIRDRVSTRSTSASLSAARQAAPQHAVSLRDELVPGRALARALERYRHEAPPRSAVGGDREVAIAVDEPGKRAREPEQERSPFAALDGSDRVRARLDLARDGHHPAPVGGDLREDELLVLPHRGRFGQRRPVVAEPVEEDVLLRPLGVGAEPGVVEKPARVGEPGDDAEGRVRDAVGKEASGLDLEDVEDALLVAALRQPEGDVGAVGGRREPVERHLGAGEGARVDDRPAAVSDRGAHREDRPASRPAGDEPKPALSVLRGNGDERLVPPARRRLPERLERGQGADRLARGRVLALLPAPGLGRVLLEPAVGVVERDSADRVHDRYRHARRSMKLRSDFPRARPAARPRLDPDAGRRPSRGADLAARGRRGAIRCRRSSSTSRTARTTRRPSRDAAIHPYFAGHGYASVRVDLRGSRRLRRHPRGRVPAAGAGGRRRGDRAGSPPSRGAPAPSA